MEPYGPDDRTRRGRLEREAIMFRRAATFVLAVLVLGGCKASPSTPTPGQPATTAPSAIPTATLAPSPSPVDVSSLFLPQIANVTRGVLDVTGSVTVGAQTGAVGGTIAFIGSDSDQVLTIAIGASTSTSETIHLAGQAFAKQGDGPWFLDPKPPVAGKDLMSVLKGVTTLRDTATETRNGVLVHKLELPAGTVVDPVAFGLTDPSMKSPAVSIVFYADETGMPISIHLDVTWSQASGATTIPASMELELRFTPSSPSFQAPTNVWSRFTSTRFHYAMARPADWDVSTSDKMVDRFQGPADAFILVDRIKVPSGTILNDAARGEIAALRKGGFALLTNQATTLGGQPARLLAFRGKAYVGYVAVTLRGGYGYESFWFDHTGHEATDLALYRQMLATFTFTK
jgi:hypothetical protein